MALAKIACDSKYWMWINGELAVFEGQLKRMNFKVEQFKSFFDELPDTSNEAAIKKFLGSIKIE